jgi:hypothetical protein
MERGAIETASHARNVNHHLQDLGVNVLHIESRPSTRRQSEFEILVDVQCDNNRMEQLVSLLRREVSAINLAQFEDGADLPPTPLSAAASFGELHTRDTSRNSTDDAPGLDNVCEINVYRKVSTITDK